MIKGGMFKCFGTTQEIKQRYGLGYEIEVKIKVPSQELIDQIIKSDLNTCCIDPVNDENDTSQKRLFVYQTLNKLMQQGEINRMKADAIKNELSILF